ncbi:MAG: putative C-S lyase [Alkalibacterium sp.]|nr:MAG: putative C-S lyase [Alkalibacterium sp.]
MMDFNKLINRKDTGSIKWDKAERLFGSKDVLPMWVADMDFDNPDPVKDALTNMIRNEVLGYTFPKDSLYQSIVNWQAEHHGMDLKPDHISFSPGVLSSIAVVVQAFTQEGDGVLIHDPVYTPFSSMVKKNNRKVFRSNLKISNNKYVMDFEDIDEQMSQHEVKLFILSNPHNPGGRVWSREELDKLVTLCIKNNVLLISDEIHSDLVYSPNEMVSPVTLKEEYKKWVITLHSATKTFNLAGVKASFIIVLDRKLKAKIKAIQQQTELDIINSFGMCATEAAFSQSADWHGELIQYLDKNRKQIIDFFDKELPDVEYMVPESTYLFWFDASTLNLESSKIRKAFAETGKIGLNDGLSYGSNAPEFMRLNFAVPKVVLSEGLTRIKNVFDAYNIKHTESD